jgi:hypothetical protein
MDRFPDQLPSLKEAEEVLLSEPLWRADGNQGAAAIILGITCQALNQRLTRPRQPDLSTERQKRAGVCAAFCESSSRMKWSNVRCTPCCARNIASLQSSSQFPRPSSSTRVKLRCTGSMCALAR